jgi:pheromone shutdown-related protein TraB
MDPRDNVTVIPLEGRTIHLVGTAHVSKKSVDEVREVIAELGPDSVCVELDQNRYDALTDEERWKNLDIFQVIKQRKVPLLLVSLALAAYQSRLGEKLGVKPGAEMLAAVEAAGEIDAEIVLADRDVQTTFRRTWGNLGLWERLKLLGAIVTGFADGDDITDETLEELKNKQNLGNMLDEFAKAFPQVKGPLIDERDAYLASKIAEAPGPTVVAVVGAAHTPGITEIFRADRTIDREALDRVPPPGKIVRALKWVLPILILSAFYVGYQRHSGEGLREMALAWLLPNSILAATFSLIAGSRLVSAATAFLASPITSLNPTIAAGMVVGLVEAWLRKPTVEDCQNVRQDAQTFRGLYKNRFTRVLLVSVMASLGSALGGWVGATLVLRLL